MPTKRSRTSRRKTGKYPLTPDIKKYLETGDHDNRSDDAWNIFNIRFDKTLLGKYWEIHGSYILKEWIKIHPCSRPFAWWELDAPGDRKRLGGIGTTDSDSTSFGVPDDWWELDAEEFYNDPDIKAIDQGDPPTFESEAVLLKRHDLLTVSEKKYLKQNPAELLPVKIYEGKNEN